MKKLKLNINRYKPKKKEDRSKIKPWQEEALEIIKTFNINGIYKGIIFKHAKSNMQYLKGKVTYVEDRFGKDNLANKGRYLISLFRKNKPWD